MAENKRFTVSYSRGRTLNLGNFESSRIDIGVTLEADSEDDLEDAYERARVFVVDRMKRAEEVAKRD